jgi:hypothetical protein
MPSGPTEHHGLNRRSRRGALGDEPAAQIGFQDRWRLQAPVR